jgi:Uncharacterized protein conserved in bacteria (DUF2334)
VYPRAVGRDRRDDELRSARLLLDAELTEGVLDAQELARALELPAVRAAVRSRRVPERPLRVGQQLSRKLGRLDFERSVAAPLFAARRAALGAGGGGDGGDGGGDRARRPPRFLVRVDEFPHYLAWDEPGRFGTEGYRRFHAIMADAGVPYLVAVPPRVSREPMDPGKAGSRELDNEERAMLGTLAQAGDVAFALHGRDHRTRYVSPRRQSELCGLDASATAELLDGALAELGGLGLSTEVFVPPFNRFDAGQYDALAQRFTVVCGGPESIGLVGFQQSPIWRGQAVYLPSYAPLYGKAREVLPAARRLIEMQCGLWAPIALHWGWEADRGWSELERLASVIAPYAARWGDFLAAVHRSAAG